MNKGAEYKMTDFKIRRGLSTVLFSAPGVINQKLVIEQGCWYLCTDTAELYLGTEDSSGKLTVKKINSQDTEISTELKLLINELDQKIISLENVELFKKINSEADLPTNFDDEDFNPNITYYIPIAEHRISTFVFDRVSESYMCTNSVDDLVIRAMVTDAIDIILDEAFATKLPNAVRNVIEGTILYGGDATPNT